MTCPGCGGIVRPLTPQTKGWHWYCYQKEKQKCTTAPGAKAS